MCCCMNVSLLGLPLTGARLRMNVFTYDRMTVALCVVPTVNDTVQYNGVSTLNSLLQLGRPFQLIVPINVGNLT